jgi:hypothetical protein
MDNPDAHLVILGCVSSHKDKPMKYYQMLANDLGLSNRVFISDEFVADEKRLCYFQAADYILLTYSGSFHSQTATLTTAVNARRLVLASSGDSPMEDLVRFFGIGVYVEPDSSDAVADGMATLLHGKLPEPDWDGYEAHATWETNVTYMLQATSDYLSGRIPQKRQFEGLEDEAQAIPELLNARRINNQKTPPKKVRPAAAKKPTARKKVQPQSASQVSNKNANGHVSENGVNGHPIFPGFETLDSAKKDGAFDSAGPATTGERPLLRVEKGKTISPRGRKRIESEAGV